MGNYIDWKKKSYCVYLYLDEEGRPYYVGMGSLRRPYVKKRWAPRPADKEKILVAPAESREAAVRMELLLIRQLGPPGSRWHVDEPDQRRRGVERAFGGGEREDPRVHYRATKNTGVDAQSNSFK